MHVAACSGPSFEESEPVGGMHEHCHHATISLQAVETSLLRMLQAQTLPGATSPIGKIHPFSKFAITFEPIMQF